MERFRVRPRPFTEESLTGYIMRVAAKNDVPNLVDLFTTLNIYYARDVKPKASQWDMFPFRVADMERLLQWTDLPENMLNSMTFVPLIRKLYINPYKNNEWNNSAIASSLVKKYRRFCSECLKERGFYNLLWQVDEIEICDIHHTKLQSHCSACFMKQPYVGDKLGELRCVNDCGFLFDGASNRAEDIEYISNQLQKYEDWRYLTHPEFQLIPSIGDFPPEKALCVSLLYVTQSCYREFRPDFNLILSKENVFDMRRFVVEDGHLSKIQLYRILAMIRKARMSVRQFGELSIPEEFVKSLFDWPRKIPEPCHTPWCSACDDERSMVRVKHCQQTFFKGVKYTKRSVCTECWVQYGEDTRDGNWKSIGDFIELGTQVRDLLERRHSRRSIAIELGVSRSYLYRIVGYLVYNRLVSQKVWEELCPVSERPADLLKRFKESLMGGGIASSKKAKLLHGWDDATYFYFLADPAVQRYYIFEAYKHRWFGTREAKKRSKGSRRAGIEARVDNAIHSFIEQDIDITAKEIAASVGISWSTLSYYGLTEKIKQACERQHALKERQMDAQLREVLQQYIHQKKLIGDSIFVEDICSFIGYVSMQQLKARFPAIAAWIWTEVKKDAEVRKHRKGEAYKAEAYRVIRELYAGGQKITNKEVAIRIGTTDGYLRKYYPDVVSYMWNLRRTLAEDSLGRINHL